MRLQTVIFGCVLVALCCLVKHSEAVACTSLNPDVPTGCTDCSNAANANADDCTTTTTETTSTTTTTTDASATTTTTVSSDTATTTTSSSGGSAGRRHLLLRLIRLRLRLIQCRRNAAKQKEALLKKIKSLTASKNTFKNKFLG